MGALKVTLATNSKHTEQCAQSFCPDVDPGEQPTWSLRENCAPLPICYPDATQRGDNRTPNTSTVKQSPSQLHKSCPGASGN